jgi:hypothetical protein
VYRTHKPSKGPNDIFLLLVQLSFPLFPVPLLIIDGRLNKKVKSVFVLLDALLATLVFDDLHLQQSLVGFVVEDLVDQSARVEVDLLVAQEGVFAGELLSQSIVGHL